MNSEIKVMEVKLNDLKETNQKEHLDIVAKVCGIKQDIKDFRQEIREILDSKADKEQFIFWRNVLISGLLLSIFIGLISIYVERLLK